MTSRIVPSGPDAEALYMNEIRRVPLLTAEEEKALAQQIELGAHAQETLGALATGEVAESSLDIHELREAEAVAEAARSEFFERNLRLVAAVVRRHPHARHIDFLDLAQEGNLALQQAVERFDWRRGLKFSTYAHPVIKGAVIRKVNEAKAQQALSLNVTVGDEYSTTELGDMLPSDSFGPDDVIDEMASQAFTEAALEHLTDRQRQAFRLYYGFDTGFPLNYREVGEVLGISKNSAHTLIETGLKTLQRKAAHGILPTD